MPFGRSSHQPQEPLQKTKAFSLETTSETVSLISESSLSVGSTVTLENLPLPSHLAFSPPWSTGGGDDDRGLGDGDGRHGLLLAPSRAGVVPSSPVWSTQPSPHTEYCVTDLGDWHKQHRGTTWDTNRY